MGVGGGGEGGEGGVMDIFWNYTLYIAPNLEPKSKVAVGNLGGG